MKLSRIQNHSRAKTATSGELYAETIAKTSDRRHGQFYGKAKLNFAARVQCGFPRLAVILVRAMFAAACSTRVRIVIDAITEVITVEVTAGHRSCNRARVTSSGPLIASCRKSDPLSWSNAPVTAAAVGCDIAPTSLKFPSVLL